MILNRQGLLNIDEMIVQEPSFQKIMEDGIVTDDELQKQTEIVIGLLRDVETRFKEEDQLLIKKLLAETYVLSAIYRYHEIQNII